MAGWSKVCGLGERLRVVTLGLIVLVNGDVLGDPPFHGTIFIDRDIIVESDPTCFLELEEKGRGSRTMFDRRVNGWVTLNPFLFQATFEDGLSIEVQVNPEFLTAAAARTEALRYMHAVGQLPTALRLEVETMWIHQGLLPFGGGNKNLLIHSEQADAYIKDGILEETLMHEAAHTSLDGGHATDPGWVSAQEADGEFISAYARDNPTREDVAETFVPYFAVQFRRDRITSSMAETIEKTIPNRIEYLNGQELDMYPVILVEPLAFTEVRYVAERETVMVKWRSVAGKNYSVEGCSHFERWETMESGISATGKETSFEVGGEWLASPRYFRVREG